MRQFRFSALFFGSILLFSGAGFAAPNAAPPPTSTATTPAPQRDQAAWELLRAASQARQTMPDGFKGFSADLVLGVDGENFTGKIEFLREGESKIEFGALPETQKSWFNDRLLNLIGHRRGGDWEKGDGRFPITFSAEKPNHYGVAVELNDRLQSRYRIKDGKVSEVTRTAGGTTFTISVLQTQEADAGKYLSNHFVVTYRDAQTLKPTMFEGYRDAYTRFEGVWLPKSRVVVEIGDAISPTTRTIQLLNFAALK